MDQLILGGFQSTCMLKLPGQTSCANFRFHDQVIILSTFFGGGGVGGGGGGILASHFPQKDVRPGAPHFLG